MRKILTGTVVFIAGIACGLVFTYGPLHAQGSISEDDIMAKLNEISKSQEDMMTAVNSIKEDLQVIKVRITQNQ